MDHGGEGREGGYPEGKKEGRDDEGKTNLDLIEAMENQNKQILLRLSFSLSTKTILFGFKSVRLKRHKMTFISNNLSSNLDV